MTTKSELRQSLVALANAIADLNSPFASPATRARWSGHALHAASLGRSGAWRNLPDTGADYDGTKAALDEARTTLEDSASSAARVQAVLARLEHILD
ncbi:MAG: hypothetical protein ACJ8DZ_11460 [Allosphingosinicella sp.]